MNPDKIKNALLQCYLNDIRGEFENLTEPGQSIVGDQKTLDLLISDITNSLEGRGRKPYEALRVVTQALSDVVGYDRCGPYSHLAQDVTMGVRELLSEEIKEPIYSKVI